MTFQCHGTSQTDIERLVCETHRTPTQLDRFAVFVRHQFIVLKALHHLFQCCRVGHWGDGTTSSSDGQRFPPGGRGDARGQVNARYGTDPGVTFYTHVSDQYAPYYTKLINAAVRDATHVLDGLLYHESELQIEEHYTDTAGFTDHVFALCHLLGFLLILGFGILVRLDSLA